MLINNSLSLVLFPLVILKTAIGAELFDGTWIDGPCVHNPPPNPNPHYERIIHSFDGTNELKQTIKWDTQEDCEADTNRNYDLQFKKTYTVADGVSVNEGEWVLTEWETSQISGFMAEKYAKAWNAVCPCEGAWVDGETRDLSTDSCAGTCAAYEGIQYMNIKVEGDIMYHTLEDDNKTAAMEDTVVDKQFNKEDDEDVPSSAPTGDTSSGSSWTHPLWGVMFFAGCAGLFHAF